MTRKEFINSKDSETLVVLGCGWSVNDVSENQWTRIGIHDTIAFNWFCLGHKTVTPFYYMVDEQGTNTVKVAEGSTADDFLGRMRCEHAIVKNRRRPSDAYDHTKNLDRINAVRHIVVKGLPKNLPVSVCRDADFVDDGVFSGKTCLGNAIHLAVWNKYKRVVFVGVDLYDMRYYWKPYDDPWSVVTNDGCKHTDKHPQADNIVRLMGETVREFPKIQWMVHNPNSLIAEHCEIWR